MVPTLRFADAVLRGGTYAPPLPLLDVPPPLHIRCDESVRLGRGIGGSREEVAVNDKAALTGGEVAAVDEASGTVYFLPPWFTPPQRGGGDFAVDKDTGTTGISPL